MQAWLVASLLAACNVTLAVMLARLLVLLSSPQIFEKKKERVLLVIYLSLPPPLLPVTKLNWTLYIWKDQNTHQLFSPGGSLGEGLGGEMEVGRYTGVLFSYYLSLEFFGSQETGKFHFSKEVQRPCVSVFPCIWAFSNPVWLILFQAISTNSRLNWGSVTGFLNTSYTKIHDISFHILYLYI